MESEYLISSAKQSSLSAFGTIKESYKIVRSHPQLLLYPYLALLFISVTYPLLSASFIAHWYNRIFADASTVAPHRFSIIVGIVTFSAFYTAFISAYFTTAVSAGVLATLEGKNPSRLYGIRQVIKHFGRVSRFALLSVFFVPMGIYAQRRKLPHGIIGILGSSMTLHMAQIAPAILLSGKVRFGETIRHSIDTMGKTWKEGLALKVGMYLTIFAVIVAPKLIQHHWYKTQTASNAGWIATLMVGASGYVFFKVINAIFTSVLYHQASQSK